MLIIIINQITPAEMITGIHYIADMVIVANSVLLPLLILFIERCPLQSISCRTYCTVCNTLPDYQTDSTLSIDTFKRYLKISSLLFTNVDATEH